MDRCSPAARIPTSRDASVDRLQQRASRAMQLPAKIVHLVEQTRKRLPFARSRHAPTDFCAQQRDAIRKVDLGFHQPSIRLVSVEFFARFMTRVRRDPEADVTCVKELTGRLPRGT
jgi:hypothetical protein